MRIIFLLVLPLILLGCTTASSPWGSAQTGGAAYHYEHTSETGEHCQITITSAREVGEANVQILDDCSVSTDVKEVVAPDISLEIIKALIPLQGLSQ